MGCHNQTDTPMPEPDLNRQLGELMCRATLDDLWPTEAGGMGRRPPRLQCRVGSGQATYHRYSPGQRLHIITYGVRMIAAKQHPETALGWLSTREIRNRGYFGGELSTLNLLAHTCCHEFAHLLQQRAGKRTHGSVHNRYFYDLLDQLHADGRAGALRRHLASRSSALGLPALDAPFALPDNAELAGRWQVGDEVTFGEGPRQRQGRILRVNRKSCTVQGTGRSAGSRYRVPLPLLSPAAA